LGSLLILRNLPLFIKEPFGRNWNSPGKGYSGILPGVKGLEGLRKERLGQNSLKGGWNRFLGLKPFP